jgi:hypothetical protein
VLLRGRSSAASSSTRSPFRAVEHSAERVSGHRSQATSSTAERHPAPTRPQQPRHHVRLSAEHRQRRDHRDRARPTRTDDPGQRVATTRIDRRNGPLLVARSDSAETYERTVAGRRLRERRAARGNTARLVRVPTCCPCTAPGPVSYAAQLLIVRSERLAKLLGTLASVGDRARSAVPTLRRRLPSAPSGSR